MFVSKWFDDEILPVSSCLFHGCAIFLVRNLKETVEWPVDPFQSHLLSDPIYCPKTATRVLL